MQHRYPANEEMANSVADALCALVMGVSESMNAAQREALATHLSCCGRLAEQAGQTLTERLMMEMLQSMSTVPPRT